MKIKITFDSFIGLPEIIEFKDKNDKIQNLKLDTELEQLEDNIYMCEDAYFLGEDCDNYDNELDFIEENLLFVGNDFENGIEYKSFEMEENDKELIAEILEDDDNSIYKKLNFINTRSLDNEIKNATQEIKTAVSKTEALNANKINNNGLSENTSIKTELSEKSQEIDYLSFDECNKYGMSAVERNFYEKQKLREKNRELIKEESQEKEQVQEQSQEKVVAQQQSYDDEMEL